MRIVLAGGGTGGHLTPLIAVAKKLREKLGSDAEMLYIGSGAPMEEQFIAPEGIPMRRVVSGKIRRYFSLDNVVDFFKFPIGIVQSLWLLLWYMPDVVFSKGGYASVPVVIAAWCYRIPVILHESDAVPGTANKILGKLADDVVLAYAHAESYFESARTAIYGIPVREGVVGGDLSSGRTMFHLTESRPTVLVLGGSQGARVINQSVIRSLPSLLHRTQIIHQTGEAEYSDVVRMAGEYGIKAGHDGYTPLAFLNQEQQRNAFAAADLVISRAGATSIAEIAANGKATILIPLQNSANDHQRMNAYEIAKIGGALVLEETNLGQDILIEKVDKILNDNELRATMGEKIKVFYHPQAAEKITDGIIRLANGE